MNGIRIAVGLIRSNEGSVLLVRKHGTTAFMQPGGKIEEGEQAPAALVRELAEELAICVRLADLRHRGRATEKAANEPGYFVDADIFECRDEGPITIRAELAEAIWFDPVAHAHLELAPLTRKHILPLVSEP